MKSTRGQASCLPFFVSVHRAPYLLRYRAFEVQEYVGRPGALHIRHPASAYSSVGDHILTISTP
jgi:hypothetical protein